MDTYNKIKELLETVAKHADHLRVVGETIDALLERIKKLEDRGPIVVGDEPMDTGFMPGFPPVAAHGANDLEDEG